MTTSIIWKHFVYTKYKAHQPVGSMVAETVVNLATGLGDECKSSISEEKMVKYLTESKQHFISQTVPC